MPPAYTLMTCAYIAVATKSLPFIPRCEFPTFPFNKIVKKLLQVIYINRNQFENI